MSDFQILELGPIERWRDFHGGFSPSRSRDGRRVLEHDLPLEFFGLTANSMVPGEQAGYWHAHALMEELYLFLTGEGEMGLDDEVVSVRAGTAVRVGQGVMRTWRCVPDSPENLTWFCIRGGGMRLEDIPSDAHPITDIRMPW